PPSKCSTWGRTRSTTLRAYMPTRRLWSDSIASIPRRNPQLTRPTVCLCDGQESLWQACANAIMDPNQVEILDLLHVTSRLWKAAKLLYGDKGKEVLPFVRQRVLQVLEGKVETVLRTLRRLGQERRLSSAKKKALRGVCSYLYKNRQRMRYHEY